MMNEISPHAYRVWIDADNERRLRIREVASISLIPGASFDDYILASISVLNSRHGGRPVDPHITLSTLSHAASNSTWLSGDNDPTIGLDTYSDSFRETYFESVGRLVQSELVDDTNQKLILTDLGKHALGSVVTPEIVQFA